nr:AAA family ATPase [uncultured Desulfobacter sp.]
MKHISFSGTHGTGKSTAAAKEYIDQKINPEKSVCVLCDMEAMCPFQINEKTTEQAQDWLFANQILRETEARARFDIVITDRTIVDVVAYTYAAGFQELACRMLGFAEHHVQIYDEITIKQAKFNQHCHNDGIRSTDLDFRMQVETILKDIYRQFQHAGAIRGSVFYA